MRQQNLNNKTLNRKTNLVFTVFTRLHHDAGITGGHNCTQSFLEVAQSSGFTVSFMVNKQLSSADGRQQNRRGNRPETTGERRNRYHQSAVIDFFSTLQWKSDERKKNLHIVVTRLDVKIIKYKHVFLMDCKEEPEHRGSSLRGSRREQERLNRDRDIDPNLLINFIVNYEFCDFVFLSPLTSDCCLLLNCVIVLIMINFSTTWL